MKHPAHIYPLQIRWSEEDNAFLGSVPGLLGECCHADTPSGVLGQLELIAEDIVEDMIKEGRPLPPAPKRLR